MFRDKNGWRVQWRSKGRRYSQSFGEDKAKARKFELQLELGEIDPVPKCKLTFGQFADQWWEDYCKVEKSESQWQRDKRTIDLHLKPELGEKLMVAINKADLSVLRTKLRGKTAHGKKHRLAPKSVNYCLGIASSIFSYAVAQGHREASPFTGFKLVRDNPPRHRFWSIFDRDKFIAGCLEVDPEFATLVLLACHTGLRLGELGALTRADLDFERRKIRVSKTFDVNLAKVLPMTKGRHDDDLPMNQTVYDGLARKRFLTAGDFVFERRVLWNARKTLGRYARQFKVPDIRFHDLRHTFVSHLAMAGLGQRQLQELARHTSYQMTQRYAHLSPDHLYGATEVLCGTQTARQEVERSKSGAPTRT